jgi:hypothetical protein
MLQIEPSALDETSSGQQQILLQLWAHENMRVFADRLPHSSQKKMVENVVLETAAVLFSEGTSDDNETSKPVEVIQVVPFGSFMNSESLYMKMANDKVVNKTLLRFLKAYNKSVLKVPVEGDIDEVESKGVDVADDNPLKNEPDFFSGTTIQEELDLSMFPDAVDHLCRLLRVLGLRQVCALGFIEALYNFLRCKVANHNVCPALAIAGSRAALGRTRLRSA